MGQKETTNIQNNRVGEGLIVLPEKPHLT